MRIPRCPVNLAIGFGAIITLTAAMFGGVYIATKSARRPVLVENQIVETGDMLYQKLTGEKVQVVNVFNESIYCRIANRAREMRDGIVSKDSLVVNYSIVCFEPYELTQTPPDR